MSLLLQVESSSEARSALENQLEQLTREKVCVYQLTSWEWHTYFPEMIYSYVLFPHTAVIFQFLYFANVLNRAKS